MIKVLSKRRSHEESVGGVFVEGEKLGEQSVYTV